MQVPYEIKEIDSLGLGLFAQIDIEAGTMIWKYSKDNTREFTQVEAVEHIESLSSLNEQQKFLDLTYGIDDKLVLILDEGKLMNHDKNPNCSSVLKEYNIDHHCYAIRNIKAGEQFSEDYGTYSHPSFLYDLLKKYDCYPDYYQVPERE